MVSSSWEVQHYHMTAHSLRRFEVSDSLIFAVEAEETYVYFLSQVANQTLHLFAIGLLCNEETVLNSHVIQVAKKKLIKWVIFIKNFFFSL